MNFRKRFSTPQAGFQMAPMVDIMFLLLIFFMAATIFAQWETKVGITVPTADTGVRADRRPGEIIVNLDAEGRMYVNNVEISIERLKGLLAQVAETFGDQPIIIRADAKTRHEAVIGVLDVCRQVDIWNVAFATIAPGEKGSE